MKHTTDINLNEVLSNILINRFVTNIDGMEINGLIKSVKILHANRTQFPGIEISYIPANKTNLVKTIFPWDQFAVSGPNFKVY